MNISCPIPDRTHIKLSQLPVKFSGRFHNRPQLITDIVACYEEYLRSIELQKTDVDNMSDITQNTSSQVEKFNKKYGNDTQKQSTVVVQSLTHLTESEIYNIINFDAWFDPISNKVIPFNHKLTDEEKINLIRDWDKTVTKQTKYFLNNALHNLHETFKNLKAAFPDHYIRQRRISAVAGWFSDMVDACMKQEGNDKFTRAEILEGVKNGPYSLGGVYQITQMVYSHIEGLYRAALTYHTLYSQKAEAIKEGKEGNFDKELYEQQAKDYKYRAQELKKMLDNFPALMTFAKQQIKVRENFTIRNFSQKAIQTTKDFFNIPETDAAFNIEESVRDAYSMDSAQRSGWATASEQLKLTLALCPRLKQNDRGDWVVATDDLGLTIYHEPIFLYRKLQNLFRNMGSVEEMMLRLCDERKRPLPEYQFIYELLNEHDDLKTLFFVNFAKDFCKYSVVIKAKNKLQRYIKVTLNQKRNKIFNQSLFNIRRGITVGMATPIYYGKKGMAEGKPADGINVEVLEKWRKYITTALTNNDSGKSPYDAYSYIRKIDFWNNVLNAIGINLTQEQLSEMLRSKQGERILFSITNTPLIQNKITEESLEQLFTHVSKSDQVPLQNFYKNVSRFVANIDNTGLERAVRVKNAKDQWITKFSDVLPSYLGTFFRNIEDYVTANDKEGLRKYITDKYLKCAIFQPLFSNQLSSNRWLDFILKACDSKQSLKIALGNFTYTRSLSFANTAVENFDTALQHLDILINYFAHRTQYSNASWASFPVFVMGDAGINKYIDAPTVKTTQELVESFLTVYYQEIARMRLANATQTDAVQAVLKSKITDFSQSANKFSYLTFLNADERFMEKFRKDPSSISPDEVRSKIEKWITEQGEKYVDTLKGLGVLDGMMEDADFQVAQQKNDKDPALKLKNFPYIRSSRSQVLKEMTLAWGNMSLAFVQQMQLMTIDPAFYPGIKMLQKRNKQEHAPGKILNIYALDIYAENQEGEPQRVSNGIEKALYINDIELKAPDAFIQALSPKLQSFYNANSLTNGENWRTPESYRALMIMAAEWSPSKERAYRVSKKISDRALAEYRNITKEEAEELSKYMEVFMPKKPITFTHEQVSLGNEGMLLVPVQNKCAEVVIFPGLLPAGSKLRDVINIASQKSIDIIVADTSIKVGNFGSVDIASANNFSELQSIISSAYIHQFDYRDYRLQTSVPDHTSDDRLLGTQIKKLIISGIQKTKVYDYFNGETKVKIGKNTSIELNGRGLLHFYNDLNACNTIQSLKNLKLRIQDKEKVKQLLMDNVTGNNKELTDHLLSFCTFEKSNIHDDVKHEGDFIVPLNEPSLAHETEAFLISLFKNIVNKQQIFGGSLVQASAFGLTSYKNESDFIFETETVIDKNGNPVRDAKGNIQKNVTYAQCEIPFKFEYKYKDKKGNTITKELDYNDYCTPDGWFMDNEGNAVKPDPETGFFDVSKTKIEQHFPGMLTLVAYRIPTESSYSMLNLKVIRCSKMIEGATIKVPLQGTTIAGFDFDIDKLFLIRKEFVASKNFRLNRGERGDFDTYHFNKSIAENSRVARNNMILHIIQQRLLDVETLDVRTTPGGFKQASKAAKLMRELLFGESKNIKSAKAEIEKESYIDPEPEYSPIDVMTHVYFTQQNAIAAKLIGIAANHNTNHILMTAFDEFKLKKPIAFCGQSLNDFLSCSREDVNTFIAIAEFLAASVDAVKDPVLNYLNLNTVTMDSACLLIRLGYTAEEIGLLMNQPIIKEICEYAFRNGVNTDLALQAIINKYTQKYTEKTGKSIDITKLLINQNFVSTESLAQTITEFRDYNVSISDKDYFEQQLHVLALFNNISANAIVLSQIVNNTKFTAGNAVGSTMGALYQKTISYDHFNNSLQSERSPIILKADGKNVTSLYHNYDDIKEHLDDIDDYLDAIADSPIALEEAAYHSMKNFIEHMGKFFPYEKEAYQVIRKDMATISKNGTLTEDQINELHREYVNYKLSFTISKFNGDMPVFYTDENQKEQTMPLRDFYRIYFPQQLMSFINSNPLLKEKYDILKYLELKHSSRTNNWLYVNEEENSEYFIGVVDGVQSGDIAVRDGITSSWEDLYLSENKTLRKVAEDLYFYFYHNSLFSINESLLSMAPTCIKEGIKIRYLYNKAEYSYTDIIRSIATETGDTAANDSRDFISQYVQNHLDDKKTRVVIPFSGPVHEFFSKEAIKYIDTQNNNTPVLEDTITLSLGNREAQIAVMRNDQGEVTWYPVICMYINGQPVYYMAAGMDANLDPDGMVKSFWEPMTYYKVDIVDYYQGNNAETIYTLDRKTLTKKEFPMYNADSFEYLQSDIARQEVSDYLNSTMAQEQGEQVPLLEKDEIITALFSQITKELGITDIEKKEVTLKSIKQILNKCNKEQKVAELWIIKSQVQKDLNIDKPSCLDEEGNPSHLCGK